MSSFQIQPGTSLRYPNRCGWSTVDVSGAYGTLTGTAAFAGGSVFEVFYDSSRGTLNVTVGVPSSPSNAALGVPYQLALTATVYGSGTAYTPGEVVVCNTAGNDSTPEYYYLCIQSSTGNNPSASPDYWAQCTTYPAASYDPSADYVPGNTVALGATAFVCLQANTNISPPNFNQPDTAYWQYTSPVQIGPPAFASGTTYYASALVTYESSTWQCIADTSTGPPASPDWALFPPTGPIPNTLADFQLSSIQVSAASGALLGSYVAPYGESPTASPVGCNVNTETELGPGYVRYFWPAGIAAGPNQPPGALIVASATSYAINIS